MAAKWRCNWCHKEHEMEEKKLESRQVADRMALGLYAQCDSMLCVRRNKSRMQPINDEAKKIYDDRYNEKYRKVS